MNSMFAVQPSCAIRTLKRNGVDACAVQHLAGIPGRRCTSHVLQPACASLHLLCHDTPPRVVIAAGLGKGFGIKASDAADKKNLCPCGSGQQYQACCQTFHKNLTVHAPSPEALLRARFAAYVKKDHKYIMRTTHSENPARQGSLSADGKVKTSFEQDVKVTMRWCNFENLHILDQSIGDDEATIDWEYTFKQVYELNTGEKLKGPVSKTIHELASFKKEDGIWMFAGSSSNWDRNDLKHV